MSAIYFPSFFAQTIAKTERKKERKKERRKRLADTMEMLTKESVIIYIEIY